MAFSLRGVWIPRVPEPESDPESFRIGSKVVCFSNVCGPESFGMVLLLRCSCIGGRWVGTWPCKLHFTVKNVIVRLQCQVTQKILTWSPPFNVVSPLSLSARCFLRPLDLNTLGDGVHVMLFFRSFAQWEIYNDQFSQRWATLHIFVHRNHFQL